MENAVVVQENRSIQSYSVNEVKAQVAQVQSLMKELMDEGIHYGKSFPGDTKKNLLKPGADKLMFMFRLRPDFDQEIKELPNGHREIITHCKVFHIESGNKIAEGVGSASTMESKFRYRNAGRKCPECGKETIKESKFDEGGFYCYAKIGGCGAKFGKNDPEIINQQVGKMENPDIADCYNTVLKISKKRAYVDATITATAASDIFTQDLEELTGEQENGYESNGFHGNGHKEPENKIAPKNNNVSNQNSKNSPQSNNQKSQRDYIEEMKFMLSKVNPDNEMYFNDKEIDIWKKMSNSATSKDEFLKVYENLKRETEKREKAYIDQIPFDEPADGVRKFDDDLPCWNEEPVKNSEIKTF